PIREWQNEQERLLAPEVEIYQAEFDAWTVQREAILADIKAATREGKKTVPKKNVAELKEDLIQLEREKPIPPQIPKLLLGDETPESLAWSLAKKYPTAGVLSNEAGVVFGSHGMGKDSAMRNLALLNMLWEGGTLSVGRRSTESFEVKDARLTIGLMVQEPTLREFFAKSGALARGTGFLARFLVAWPESTQGYRLFTEAPKDWPHLEAHNQRITEILNLPMVFTEAGGLLPETLELTPEAKTDWVAYHDAIERELSKGGVLHDVRDVAGKTADNAARLAALFQIFESGVAPISADNFDRASRIATWHLSESRRFLGELALPDELQDAVNLDAWLFEHCLQNRTESVNKNYVRQYGKIRDKTRLDNAIKYLAELDRVRVFKEGRCAMIHLHPALVRV
ncbi:MAG: YfjI family protein, partial [Pseudomonadales bacterium]